MATYKVPQDVEADDKLLGPFTFRQFIYLVIVAGLGALAFYLFKISPLLIIIPLPPILLLLALALPLKKDQPMETYLAAIISFYTKPHKRIWEAGEPESSILITAPKQVEENRTKNLSQEEASHRLSFLAEIVDTEGYAIKNNSPVRAEITAEANAIEDIFDAADNLQFNQSLQTQASASHDAAVARMRQAIEDTHNLSTTGASLSKFSTATPTIVPDIATAEATVLPSAVPQPAPATPAAPAFVPEVPALPDFKDAVVIQPDLVSETAPTPTPPTETVAQPTPQIQTIVRPQLNTTAQTTTEAQASTTPPPTSEAQPSANAQTTPEAQPEPSVDLVNLANNPDFSIETIAQQAKRLHEKNNDEVYINLH